MKRKIEKVEKQSQPINRNRILNNHFEKNLIKICLQLIPIEWHEMRCVGHIRWYTCADHAPTVFRIKNPKQSECDVNCHKKCERLTANLCGVNQKLIVEALNYVKRGNVRPNSLQKSAKNRKKSHNAAKMAKCTKKNAQITIRTSPLKAEQKIQKFIKSL